MSEGEIPKEAGEAALLHSAKKDKAGEVVRKREHLIDNPIARFNLNLDGSNPEQFDPNFVEPVLTQELKDELNDPRLIPDPETQQRLNTLVLNRGASLDCSPVTIFIPPINNEISQSNDPSIVNHTHYRIQELARQLSDSQLIAFDYPSVGASDKMTDRQVQAFKMGSGFDEIARTQLRILREMNVKDINIIAQSLGAFTGAQMARLAKEYGIHVSNAVLTETPGVLDSSTLDMFKNRLNPENAYLGLYHAATFDPAHLPDIPVHPIKKTMQDLKWLVKGAVRGKGLSYGREVSRPSLEPVLQAALTINPDMKLTLINGSASRVAPHQETHDVVDWLQQNGFKDRIRRVVFPGETHVVMEQAKRYAWMSKLALRK